MRRAKAAYSSFSTTRCRQCGVKVEQAFRFSPDKWRDELPDPALWPPELDAAPKAGRDGQELQHFRELGGFGGVQFHLRH
jgi:hypothetical protein